MKNGNNRKAQLSTEFMQILAVSLLILTVFIIISQSSGADINKAKTDSDAKNTISDISGAARQVYAQGAGAKQKVLVAIPSGMEPGKSYIANNSVVMHVSGNDYVSMEAFDMHGTLPASEGSHWIWVVSEGNKVRIGYAMVELSRNTLLITMGPNESISKTFDVSNLWDNPVNISVDYSWDQDHITSLLNPGQATLGKGENSTFTISFASDDKAVGVYLAEIGITASEGMNKEYVRLPVVVQVLTDNSDRAPLTAIPPILNATLNWSQTVSRSFQICTNEVTSVTSVDFTLSSGEPGSWAGNTFSLGAIAPDSCAEKIITVTIPNGSAPGNSKGYASMRGNGAANAEDSIALDITVGGTGDNQGPDVRNVTTGERRVHVNKPVTIYAVGDDSLKGNSSIKECFIRADAETSWSLMDPADGVYNTPVENINYTFSGFEMGNHTVYLRCTDVANNVGNITAYSFVIGKHILFVTASGNESDWSEWVDMNPSETLGKWQYDIADFTDVENDAVDMHNYDAVIFLDWKRDDVFVSKVNKYKSEGGYVGLFGDSAHLAVRDLNVTWHPDNPHPESSINIINNTHYVTQGFQLTTGTASLLQISDTQAKIYELWGDPLNTNELGYSGWFYPGTARVILAEVNSTMFWGPMDPFKLNENGALISTRVIDYMINNSKVK